MDCVGLTWIGNLCSRDHDRLQVQFELLGVDHTYGVFACQVHSP